MIEDKIVVGAQTAYPLKGLLTLPEQTDGPVPAVVFVHGSGSSNMDEKIGRVTPFKDLAEGLAKHGIASIRYDKRTFAHGLKLFRDKNLVITVKEETIEDAVLATELLKQDPRIDPERVFIIGHSMGGMLAPRIDAEGGSFRGLVLMAGTPRTLEEVMVGQTEDIMAGSNRFLNKILGKQLQKISSNFIGMYDLTDEAAKRKKMGNGTTLYYFKEMGEHPAADYLRELQKPILILQGEKDVQVKVDRDFVLYRELLEDKPNAAFKLYENLNHAFVPAIYDNIMKAKKEFSAERHIGEDVIADIANWIKAVSAS